MAALKKPIKLLPLANPRGVQFMCELCRGTAYLKCPDCRVSYYCGPDHMKIDMHSIHTRICHLMASLRRESDEIQFMSAQHAADLRRNRRENYLREVIDITEKVGKRHLFENHPADAIPAALQHMHCTTLLFGSTSVDLALSYAMLAEASVGLHRLSQAKNYLSQAHWIVLQQPSCPDSVKYRIYRVYGIIHAAERQFDAARRCFADDIYCASEAFGHGDIRTSGGYFQLAKVFNELNEGAIADSLFDKVVDCWCNRLTKLVRAVICGPVIPKIEPYDRDAALVIKEDRCLDEAEAAEATLVLNFIFMMKNGPQRPDKVPKTSHCLAMLNFLREDAIKAEHYGRLALYETEDLPYRLDAEQFVKEYAEELKKVHGVELLD